MKRDLKADLEICNKATPGPWRAGESFVITFHDEWICEVVGEYSMDCEDNMRFVAQAREGWPHAIERALEAEALARELVAALQGISGMLDYTTSECRCGVCEYCNVQKRADKALAKTKEVLGDD